MSRTWSAAGSPWPGDVGDGQSQNLFGHRDVVVEVAAHRFHRIGAAGEIEMTVGRRAAGEDGGLDLARLGEDPFHPLAPDFLIQAVAQDAQGEEDVVPAVVGIHVEGQDVLLVSDLDGDELADADQVLEALVHPRIVGVHVDRALFQHELDRGIGERHLEPASVPPWRHRRRLAARTPDRGVDIAARHRSRARRGT